MFSLTAFQKNNKILASELWLSWSWYQCKGDSEFYNFEIDFITWLKLYFCQWCTWICSSNILLISFIVFLDSVRHSSNTYNSMKFKILIYKFVIHQIKGIIWTYIHHHLWWIYNYFYFMFIFSSTSHLWWVYTLFLWWWLSPSRWTNYGQDG